MVRLVGWRMKVTCMPGLLVIHAPKQCRMCLHVLWSSCLWCAADTTHPLQNQTNTLQVWTMVLRLVDDVKASVREAGAGTLRSLRGLSLRLMDAAQTPAAGEVLAGEEHAACRIQWRWDASGARMWCWSGGISLGDGAQWLLRCRPAARIMAAAVCSCSMQYAAAEQSELVCAVKQSIGLGFSVQMPCCSSPLH